MRHAVWVALTLIGCGGGFMTKDEAKDALIDSLPLNGGAFAISDTVVPPGGNFGLAVNEAAIASAVQNFWLVESNCADASVGDDNLTVTVDFGFGCSFRGRELEGTYSVKVTDRTEASAELEQTWTGFISDGVAVEGSALVTWNEETDDHTVLGSFSWTADEVERQVESELVLKEVVEAYGPADVIEDAYFVGGAQTSIGPEGVWRMEGTDGAETRQGEWASRDADYKLINMEEETSVGVSFWCLRERVRRVSITELRGGNRIKFDLNQAGDITDLDPTVGTSAYPTSACGGDY